jgi:hypothetical protein
MPEHLYFDLGQQSRGAVVEVGLDNRAAVRLLDDTNYSLYKRGVNFYEYGGWAVQSPARVVIPSAGHWNLALDLNGGSGSINATVNVR